MVNMHPYRFNLFDLDLLRRLTDRVYLKSDHFEFKRYPKIYWGNFNDRTRLPGYQRINERNDLDNYDDSKFDIDLLGCYYHNHNQEGYIEIYGDRIHECSFQISSELGLDFMEIRSLLQTIVLLHEIGHWFTHCCFQVNRANRMQFFRYQTKEIKETLAQLSVLWATLGLNNHSIRNLREIMSYLTNNQSRPYRQYLKLGTRLTKKSTILNRYIKLLDMGNCDLEYLLLNNKIPDPHRSI